jgi:hypothetical protein
MWKISIAVIGLLCAGEGAALAQSCTAPAVAPPIAQAVGYVVNTFSTGPFTTTNTDTGLTYAKGYQWYGFNFFGVTPTFANNTINASDGSITAGQGGDGYNSNVATAGYIATAPGYVGTAFGGGAYVQAIVKFNVASADISNGWPSFWANAMEEYLGTDQWPGQATGYVNFIEADLLEHFLGAYGTINQYQATLINWYGIPANPTPHITQFVDPSVPAANFSSYNTVAMLWVPATATTSGYVNYYWNGSVVQSISYTQYQTSDTPPLTNSTPWAYGVMDVNHFVLQFGSNNQYPITVYSVQVWQANSLSNMHN